MKRGFLAIVAGFLVLSGCAAMDVNELRTRMAAHTYNVNKPYQVVYQHILDQARKCHQGGGFFGPLFMVQNDLLSDSRTGNISLVRANGGIAYSIDVTYVAQNAAIVTFREDERFLGTVAPVIQSWANGGYSCSV